MDPPVPTRCWVTEKPQELLAMQSDVRGSDLYREAEALHTKFRRPGLGQVSDAAEIHVSPNNREAVFVGTIVERLVGALPTRICHVDLESGRMRVLTSGPGTDRLPKYSPDGRRIAFLSDRDSARGFQLYLLDPESNKVQVTPPVVGWVEYLHWAAGNRQSRCRRCRRARCGTDPAGGGVGAVLDAGR
jgi:dipeptidyl aminopeptidase/acylaminoacyl peptidase